MPDLQAALRDTDGIALSLTPLKAPEIAVAPRLRSRRASASATTRSTSRR